MNHAKEQIREMVLKIMTDLENDYFFENKITINFEHNLKPLWGNVIPNAWSVAVGIPDFQFQDELGALITIYINDDTGEVVNYVEGPGRPVPATVSLNAEGNYELIGLNLE